MKSIRSSVILIAVVVSACSSGTVSPSTVATSPAAATASPAASPSAAAGTPFQSAIYPYTIQLPDGWQAHQPSSDEDFFEGPDEMSLTIGSGKPEPGQTVEDRVAANRLEFMDCTTDPAGDAPIALGGEPGILWSFQCGSILGLAANTIHAGVGYRLMVKLPDSAQAMARATALMDGFRTSFAFTR
jgi:hypothetical protein